MTYSFINQNPDFSDAAVLTGFSQVPNFIVGFALGGNFKPVKEISSLAGSYPAGYVSVDTTIGLNIQFFAPGDFDPKMLSYATAHGQPATPGEILTLGAGSGNTNAFSGKVLVITGGEYPGFNLGLSTFRINDGRSITDMLVTDRDLPFCGGNCTDITAIQGAYPDLIAASKPSFPNATFSSVVVPNGGHGLNLGFSAKSAYDSIFKFLETSL